MSLCSSDYNSSIEEKDRSEGVRHHGIRVPGRGHEGAECFIDTGDRPEQGEEAGMEKAACCQLRSQTPFVIRVIWPSNAANAMAL